MNNKKLSVAVLSLAVFSLFAFSANAQVFDMSQDQNTFAQRITERFKLNIQEVQDFLSQIRAEIRERNEAKMQEMQQKRLEKALENGKITQEQKNSIETKMQEMKQAHEDLMSLEPEERRERADELRDEMKEWTESQGIELGIMRGLERGFSKAPFGQANGFGKKGDF